MTNPFCPDTLKDGVLPPWEVAKAYAFHVVVKDVAEMLGERPADILGKRVDEYIASRLCLKGGGHPSARNIRKLLANLPDSSWYPGKNSDQSPGRPPVYSEHVKDEIARVGMELKRKNMAPTPRKVRARLPQLTRHPDTGRLTRRPSTPCSKPGATTRTKMILGNIFRVCLKTSGLKS
jgi:hypothetical protein